MRLEWKYTLIINVLILMTMSAFFIINDRMIRKEAVLSVMRDYIKGASMREIASDIQERITGEYDADRLANIIRSINLNKSGLEIVDINIMDSNGVIVASLTGESLYDQLDSDGLQKVKSKQMRVRYPPKGYRGHWVIEYTLPYIESVSPEETEKLGALQIMFSAQGIAINSRRLRIEQLIYIATATIALAIIINPLTNYLIVRRLERLMDTIASAQAGNLAARSKDLSRDEIGRLGRSFNRMIEQISSEHDSRLKALGTLAAGVAHEVRNPLNSIAMTIQYLKDTLKETLQGADSDSEVQECLDVVTRQVKELNQIVEEFLQLTRPVEMNWKMTDLNNFLVNVIRNFTSALQIAKIKLICDYSKDPLYIKVDHDKLRQAISNIIINSIQAMPDGGELRIITARDVSRNSAIIQISDTGVGIPQENLDRLFEPYFTTKPNGTGLGLAITYKMVEAHGGEIRVESIEGQGAIFTIVLP